MVAFAAHLNVHRTGPWAELRCVIQQVLHHLLHAAAVEPALGIAPIGKQHLPPVVVASLHHLRHGIGQAPLLQVEVAERPSVQRTLQHALHRFAQLLGLAHHRCDALSLCRREGPLRLSLQELQLQNHRRQWRLQSWAAAARNSAFMPAARSTA